MAFLQCKKCPRSAHIQPYGPAYVTYRDCLGNCIENKDEASTAPATELTPAQKKYPVLKLKS